ncbi:MAG: RNA polymerase sigma factor [Solirubrobacterales bacterium]|nr:RNA polymerase sigma factor [Solirubrobacterales bacterium]
MEVSALRYSGGIGLHARSPLLRLQSDERLISLIRRGSTTAFEVLVSRYHARLLAFCRHLLGSREDAEDVLQEVFSAAFNAILDDDRPINVRPWLYRIARNRSLNHLRRIQAVGVDSMDIHLFDHGATTADKVHEREEFRLLVGDIQGLPETQRTALVLREMDALSYEQIAEAMETTVPSVKSLLVRARVSLAEAAEARMLTCEEVRLELGEVAEGLRRRPGPLVRRHLRTCERCATFKSQLGDTSKALAALLPIGFAPLALLRKLAIVHLGHSAGAGSSASGAGAAGQAAAVGSTAAAGASAMLGSTGGGFLSASVGAIATKAAAGLAAAALVTAGAVEVDQPARTHHHTSTQAAAAPVTHVSTPTTIAAVTAAPRLVVHRTAVVKHVTHKAKPANATGTHKTVTKPPVKPTTLAAGKPHTKAKAKPKVPPGRTQTQTDATVLAQSTTPTVGAAGSAGCSDTTSSTPATTTTSPSTTTTTSAPQSSDTSTTGSTTTGTTPTTTSSSSSAPAASADTTRASSSSSCASDSSGAGSGSASSGPSGGVSP